MKKHKNTLSFQVMEIVERFTHECVVYDTKLRFYPTNEIITIRGKPWSVGSKVDFTEIL